MRIRQVWLCSMYTIRVLGSSSNIFIPFWYDSGVTIDVDCLLSILTVNQSAGYYYCTLHFIHLFIHSFLPLANKISTTCSLLHSQFRAINTVIGTSPTVLLKVLHVHFRKLLLCRVVFLRIGPRVPRREDGRVDIRDGFRQLPSKHGIR